MPNWQEPCHIPLKNRHGTQQEPNGPEAAGTKRAEQPHGLSCVARFERSAGVLADRAALANQSPTTPPHKTSGRHTFTLRFHPTPNQQVKNQSAVSKVPCQVSRLMLHGTTQKQAYNAKWARAVSHSSEEPSRHSARSKRPEHSRHKAGRAALGLSCVARFERSAGVLADRAALAN